MREIQEKLGRLRKVLAQRDLDAAVLAVLRKGAFILGPEVERLETEVQLARQIQQTFIPETLPSYGSWQLSARWRTARQQSC